MVALIFFLLGCIPAGYAAVQKLPLPRFASLRSSKVNMHVGPGRDFPVEWTFQRQGLPVEIIAEFDTWRQIRDMEGTMGWVHKSLLTGKRTAVITSLAKHEISKEQPLTEALRKTASQDAAVVVYVQKGVITKLKQCKGDWCHVDVKGYDGWIRRSDIWGVYQYEEKF